MEMPQGLIASRHDRRHVPTIFARHGPNHTNASAFSLQNAQYTCLKLLVIHLIHEC